MPRAIFGTLLLLGCLAVPSAARACPLCRDAVSKTSDADADDQLREARAYNNSIYLMVSMPYLAFGGVGLMVYRHIRQRARLDDALIAQLDRGSVPCHHSPGEAS
jgi:hypothetical protein